MSNPLPVEFIRFGLVGITGMAIDFGVTWFCKEKIRLNKYLSNSLGFCCAVVSNFLLNRNWTFQSTQAAASGQFLKFAVISVLGLAINNLLLFLLVKTANKNFYLLKLLVTGLVFFWNYFLNRFYTFR